MTACLGGKRAFVSGADQGVDRAIAMALVVDGGQTL
jgi:NAD(P)-dependent dehydrogenase (short-subunit alcohol dehydrogenase family)